MLKNTTGEHRKQCRWLTFYSWACTDYTETSIEPTVMCLQSPLARQNQMSRIMKQWTLSKPTLTSYHHYGSIESRIQGARPNTVNHARIHLEQHHTMSCEEQTSLRKALTTEQIGCLDGNTTTVVNCQSQLKKTGRGNQIWFKKCLVSFFQKVAQEVKKRG